MVPEPDDAWIARRLDHPPVVLKSTRFRFVLALLFGTLVLLAFWKAPYGGKILSTFDWWLLFGVIVGLIFCVLMCVKILIWPMRIEISPSGVLYTNDIWKRRYYWADITGMRSVKGYWTGRFYMPGFIVLEIKQGGRSSSRTEIVGDWWTISRDELAALLGAAHIRWSGTSQTGQG